MGRAVGESKPEAELGGRGLWDSALTACGWPSRPTVVSAIVSTPRPSGSVPRSAGRGRLRACATLARVHFLRVRGGRRRPPHRLDHRARRKLSTRQVGTNCGSGSHADLGSRRRPCQAHRVPRAAQDQPLACQDQRPRSRATAPAQEGHTPDLLLLRLPDRRRDRLYQALAEPGIAQRPRHGSDGPRLRASGRNEEAEGARCRLQPRERRRLRSALRAGVAWKNSTSAATR